MVLINPVSKVDIIISLSMEMITLDLDLFFASHFGPKRGILNSRNAMFGFLPQCPQHNSSGAYSVSEAGLGSQTALHRVTGGLTSAHQMGEPFCGNHLQRH